MNEALLQPAATITAALLGASMDKARTPLAPDAVQKLFVAVFRQLEAAQKELQGRPAAK